MTSTYFSTFSILPLSFLLTGASVMTYYSMFSFLDNDLVKGLLDLVSTIVVGEGKSNLLPFFPVLLDEGISANSGAGWVKIPFVESDELPLLLVLVP
jgi:hypothetical protein